jgi:hypothetical protein
MCTNLAVITGPLIVRKRALELPTLPAAAQHVLEPAQAVLLQEGAGMREIYETLVYANKLFDRFQIQASSRIQAVLAWFALALGTSHKVPAEMRCSGSGALGEADLDAVVDVARQFQRAHSLPLDMQLRGDCAHQLESRAEELACAGSDLGLEVRLSVSHTTLSLYLEFRRNQSDEPFKVRLSDHRRDSPDGLDLLPCDPLAAAVAGLRAYAAVA